MIELCRVAAEYGGMYISHIRSEGNGLLQAVDELLQISREARIPAEIYHLKAAGAANWAKLDQLVAKVTAARAAGLRITADMYTYPAGATGLDAAMPPWVQEGGLQEWRKRLQDPDVRRRVKREMATPTDAWENLYLGAGSPERVLLEAVRNGDGTRLCEWRAGPSQRRAYRRYTWTGRAWARMEEPELSPAIGKTREFCVYDCCRRTRRRRVEYDVPAPRLGCRRQGVSGAAAAAAFDRAATADRQPSA